MYDAYIEKEDLFGKTGEMKVIYTREFLRRGIL